MKPGTIALLLVSLVLVSVGVTWAVMHDHAVAAAAVSRYQGAKADSAIAYWKVRADSIQATETTDTVVLTRERPVYRTLHDTVLTHLTDTVLVKEFVRAADSTVNSCTRALKDCGALTAALRSELDASTLKVTALTHLQPTFLARHALVGMVLTGIAGAYLGTRIK